jgi:hypothetical protein
VPGVRKAGRENDAVGRRRREEEVRRARVSVRVKR